MLPKRLLELRLLKRLDRSGPCWIWTGCLYPTGYGLFVGNDRLPHRAHRIAYELWKGPIPAGLVIDHLCCNRACCNPAHLEAVTQRENVLRARARQYSKVR